MNLCAVFTDLDGTLLEPDGTLCEEASAALSALRESGVPVYPVTSKTAAELGDLMRELGLLGPAGFENGAGVLNSDGTPQLHPRAVPIADLMEVFSNIRRKTGVYARSILEVHDEELTLLTGLRGAALAAARRRLATLPLLVAPISDEVLRMALPRDGALRLVRGNRFLHLQGDHHKSTVLPLLIRELGDRKGAIVTLGDSPNDAELLAAGDVAVIIPGPTGPHPELVSRFPNARIAPFPQGRGWAAAVRRLLDEK